MSELTLLALGYRPHPVKKGAWINDSGQIIWAMKPKAQIDWAA